MRMFKRAGLVSTLSLLAASALSAQTLQQAEALWKARRFKEAYAVFEQLIAKNPKNPDYIVSLGRMYLDHNEPDAAGDEFEKALEIKKDHAGALVGLSLISADTYDPAAAELARKAIAADPKCLEAQELLARFALEDNNNPKAIEEANKALAIDPNSVQGKAILASIDWLADKKDTPYDPHAAKGYETAGHFFTLNRRYEEAIQFYRKAIEMDPQLYSARSQLGISLMRLGDKDEAYKQLKLCFDNEWRDKATNNSLTLMDSYKNFVTFKTDNTILILHKKEANLLHPYFESELKRAIDTYEKKYKLKLDKPVQLEVYPDHADFAVRTLGMPGLGALGVTFGYSVAMDSPSGRKPGEFHWASTMWHELSHVFTLTATGHRVPRWFTEGLAVHEETARSPEWGDRLGPEEIGAIKEHRLLPVAELDRGFIHPKNNAQVVISYFQAGRICDYINKKWGWDTLLAMLKDFAKNEDTPTVIRKELKMEPADFDKEFLAQLEAETKPVVDHIDDWKKGVQTLAHMYKEKDWDGIIRDGPKLRDFYPDYVEDHSVYEMLGQAYVAKDQKPAAIAEFERYVKAGGRNPDTIQQTAKLLQEAGNPKEAAAVLERLNYIYPMVNAAHQSLGDLWIAENNAAGAVREYGAIVAHAPVDPAKAHYDLARAYHLNKQDEQAKDELLAALETAPGYRQAQKLLLELNESGTQHDTVKK